jgi:hypothetical protein
MAGTPAFRLAGQTVALSVVATSHAAVALATNTPDLANWCALLNPGAVAVAVKISQSGAPATLPVDGTPGDFILPPLMEFPIVIPMPTTTPQITAIGATAGPTIIYATPVVYQS